jgi:hypothetical protein
MLSTLRVAVVIGIIFYLSPVRHGNGRSVSLDDVVKWSQDTVPSGMAAPVEQAAQLGSLWRALPDGARTALAEQIAGTNPSGSTLPAPSARAADTLIPDDLKPVWRSDARKRH